MLASTWEKGLKSRSCADVGTPMPVSEISKRTVHCSVGDAVADARGASSCRVNGGVAPGRTESLRVTPPLWENLMALPRTSAVRQRPSLRGTPPYD